MLYEDMSGFLIDYVFIVSRIFEILLEVDLLIGVNS